MTLTGDLTDPQSDRERPPSDQVAAARRLLAADRHRADPSSRLLTADEEVGLALLMRDGGGEPAEGFAAALPSGDERRAAFDALVIHNLRLVRGLARSHLGRGLEFDDLVHHGALGLMRAVEKFDPAAGTEFSTYATWWVRRRMSRAVADEGTLIRVPVHLHEVLRKVQSALSRLLERAGTAEPPQVAAEAGVPVDTATLALRVALPVESLDALNPDEVEHEVWPRGAVPGPEEVLDGRFGREWVECLLAPLPARDADVVRRRVGIVDGVPQTLEDIGQSYGISRERVRQLEKRALGELRERVHAAPGVRRVAAGSAARLAVSGEFLAAYARLAPRLRRRVDTAVTAFQKDVDRWLERLECPREARDPRVRLLPVGMTGASAPQWSVVVLKSGDVHTLVTVSPPGETAELVRLREFPGEMPADPAKELDGQPERPDRLEPPAVIVDGPEELRGALAHPFVVWRTFLHPDQRKIAYRESYTGPVQVSGGAGTGKTMIALHRASYLAHRAARDGGTVLLTTFARNLADALDRRLAHLIDDADIYERVEVSSVDRLAARVVRGEMGRHPQMVAGHELEREWGPAAREAGLPYGGAFLVREWEQVMLAQRITTEEEYLSCARPGRGSGLPRSRRTAVWRLVHRLTGELEAAGRRTYLQLADEAARILAGRGERPYHHIVVDEAQDLHPAQWRLLRAAVGEGPDDLFLVGDPHQRIHNHRVSLSALGINVRGRGVRVKVNYRTTQEILAWAVPLLGGAAVQGLDGTADDLAGYASPVHGDKPRVHAAADDEAELSELVAQVGAWMNAGVDPVSIAVTARFFRLARRAHEALGAAGIPATFMGGSDERDAVQVGTMHKAKGLEFRCVAVIGASAELIPNPGVLTPEGEDPVSRALDLQRERNLLFVACTRARDQLYVSHVGAPSPFIGEQDGR
ncbi:sigma-70 family RNA polymerase sigma factor [Sinosporangium siamense]|uniref:RNA polymerase sigma factor n=1 Tax=Sinosporangium siamense TaxID=1367973 RepID=A0A919RFY8_9ACTN|nr:sigma-70 family RNA polymerase sigma factor [Sinosporangium siamense]GII91089.1 hypothetical protein Ssi02_13200 [Sinosporangium siamense]